MTRKVSVDSIGDPETDEVLRVLCDLVFRRPSTSGWLAAGALGAVPAWAALECLRNENLLGGLVFLAAFTTVLAGRLYCLRRVTAQASE